MRKQQTFKGFKKQRDEFGGSLLKSNPKTKRPIDSNFPTHVVLKATKSILRLPKVFGVVNKVINKISEKHGLRVYRDSVGSNHIHLLIRIPRRHRWSPYIRELTGQIATAVKDLLNLKEKLWKYRPFSRIVRGWKKAFEVVAQYIEMNEWEAEGFIDYHDREFVNFLKEQWRAG